MRGVIKFGKTVTFENLNPHNFHLKNDYINNLLFVALSIFPAFNSEGIDATVTQGFVSASYAEQNKAELKDRKHASKFWQGLALAVTWDGYDSFDAITIVPRIVQKIQSNVHARIVHPKQEVEFYFEMPDESKVFEVTEDEERQIA